MEFPTRIYAKWACRQGGVYSAKTSNHYSNPGGAHAVVTRPLSFWIPHCFSVRIYFPVTAPVKKSHYRPGKALRVPGGCVSQISWQLAQEGGKVVSPTHWSPLPPRKYSWYSFLLEAESTPGPQCGRNWACRTWKIRSLIRQRQKDFRVMTNTEGLYAVSSNIPQHSWYSFLLEAESTPGPQCGRNWACRTWKVRSLIHLRQKEFRVVINTEGLHAVSSNIPQLYTILFVSPIIYLRIRILLTSIIVTFSKTQCYNSGTSL